MKKVIDFLRVVGVLAIVAFVVNFGWHFFTDAPSTQSVCYTWSKATDPYLVDEYGIDGAQWLADHIKSEDDLKNIDPAVLSAMRLYDTGAFLDEIDAYNRMGLHQFVIDACEKAEPGSTTH